MPDHDNIKHSVQQYNQLPAIREDKYYLSLSLVGHDDSITVSRGSVILETIELERFFGRKNYGFLYVSTEQGTDTVFAHLLDLLNYIFTKYTKNFECVFYIERVFIPIRVIGFSKDGFNISRLNLSDYIKSKHWIKVSHHTAHACASFFQSNFDKALVLTFDGGSEDYMFNAFVMGRDGSIEYYPTEQQMHRFCANYYLGGMLLKDIRIPNKNRSLIMPGKIMGYCGYGKPIEELVDFFKIVLTISKSFEVPDNFKETVVHLTNTYGIDVRAIFNDHRARYGNTLIKTAATLGKLENEIEFHLQHKDQDWFNNRIDGQTAYDVAASLQVAFEQLFDQITAPYFDMHPDLPVCFSGGGSLNILNNTRVLSKYNRPIFIPPDPNDSGLSLGCMLYYLKPNQAFDNPYTGLELLDIEDLQYYLNTNQYETYNLKDNIGLLADKILDGLIIGVARGKSERGPRALGNRSIICNVLNPDMKDIINAKVKNREWFRPFSPLVRLEDVDKYFEWCGELRFMSFSPKVKPEYIDIIKPVVHVDHTARVQTITRDQNTFVYDLLTILNSKSGIGMILNTSFNVDGKPILTTIKDAFAVLESTKLDGIVIEDLLILKHPHRNSIVKATENP